MENEAERPVLAIDLGGTQIRAALITPDLSVHARRAVPTGDDDGVTAVHHAREPRACRNHAFCSHVMAPAHQADAEILVQRVANELF